MSGPRLLLIHPASPRPAGVARRRRMTDQIFRQSVLPLLYVAAATPSHVETRIVDEEVEEIDFDADVDLVGLSFMTQGSRRAYEIAERFRRERGIPVIMGGFHPTMFPQDAAPHADALCIGDAENKMERIIQDFTAGRLQPVYDGPQPDLATLPFPDRSKVSRSPLFSIDTILATRGCPFRCTFCSVTAFYNQTFRMRPVEHVVEELRTLRRRVLFVDDNLIANRDYALELFGAMAPLKKRWYGQVSLRIAEDRELLNRAAAAGCRGVFVGFESLSEPNLQAWRKTFNRPQAYARAVRALHDAGMAVFAGIVLGMDDDTPAVFRKTLAFIHEAGIDFTAANILTPFPGTPLYDEMEGSGRIFDHDWANYDFDHVVFQPRHMSVETLRRGTRWVRAQIYRARAVGRRIARSFQYLDPATVLHAVLPLNLGFHSYMSRSGTMRRGLRDGPPEAA